VISRPIVALPPNSARPHSGAIDHIFTRKTGFVTLDRRSRG
jgi:hypothetical protein